MVTQTAYDQICVRSSIISSLVALAFLLVLTGSAGGVSNQEPRLSRLVLPADGRSHFGFTFLLFDSSDPVWGDTRPFDERIRDSIQMELAGKTPTFLNVWAPWQHPDLPGKPLVPFAAMLGDVSRVSSVVGESGIVYLDWNIASTTVTNDGITTRDVAAGKLDGYIRRYARAIREYGRPLLVRLFNGEFNGSWWQGVSPKANYGLTTADFVNAWRRVVDIFRAVGATNVSWAWVPNAYPQEPGLAPGIDRDLAAYWPGDDYVDWAGADFYDVGPPSWLDGPYAFAVAHNKPLFIGEFGIRHEWSGVPPGQWRFWLEAAFDYFESHPAIKAICYFNLNYRFAATRVKWDPSRDVFLYDGRVRYTPDVNDLDARLLAGGPDVRALFSTEIAAPRYVSTISTEPVESTPTPPSVVLSRPVVRRGIATVRWRANLAADRYDVAVRRGARAWRLAAQRLTRTAYTLNGKAGDRVWVKVLARDVFGGTSPWTSPIAIRFPPADALFRHVSAKSVA